MSQSPSRLAGVAFLAWTIVVTAARCSPPPYAEKEAAEASVRRAVAAGAETYAPEELGAATDALNAAQRLTSDKRYGPARDIYILAKVLAETATQNAETRKAPLQAQVERDVVSMEQRWLRIERWVRNRTAVASASSAERREWEEDAERAVLALRSARSLAHDCPTEAKINLTMLDSVLAKWERKLQLPRAP